MYSTFITLALVLAPTLTPASAFQTWYPTTVGACQSLSYAWESSAVWPVDALIVDPASPCGDPLIDAGEISGTSANTTINLVPGTQIQLSLLDANDDESWSSPITVVDSGDYSCFSDDVASSLSAAASSTAALSSAVASASAAVSSATGLVLTSAVDASSTLSVAASTHTSSAHSSTSSTGAEAVGAVGTGSDSGAAAIAVPFTLLVASLATMLLL